MKPGTVHSTFFRKWTTAATSKNSTRSACSRTSTDLKASRLPPPPRATSALRPVSDRLRPHHEVGQLPVRPWPDLLGEVTAARLQHPRDLRPHAPRSDACSPPGQSSRRGNGRRHRRPTSTTMPAERREDAPRQRQVGRPGLGRRQHRAASAAAPRSSPHRACQHFAAAGLDVQHGPRARRCRSPSSRA